MTDNSQQDSWKSFSGSANSGKLSKVLALDDFEPLARKKLPKAIYGYIAGAAETNSAFANNLNGFNDWNLVPRVLRNAAGRSLKTTLFGVEYSAPFGIAPMGVAALSCYQGDTVLATVAAKAGIPFVLSGTSLTPLEAIAQAAPGSWFQAYLPGTPERIDALLDRAARASYQTLVITADVPVAGNRENILKSGFSTPLRPSLRLMLDGITHPSWVANTFFRTLLDGMPHFENSFAERGAPIISRTVDRDFSQRDHFDWSHIARIRKHWKGTLVIKGILAVDDAVLARDHGADGIVLSNHGGRQLDYAISPMAVLPKVVEKLPDLPIMLDGGVRRASDVMKALALGAKMVFVGRPFNYAAAVDGSKGVEHAVRLLKAELDRNYAMLGIRETSELSSSFLIQSYRANDATR